MKRKYKGRSFARERIFVCGGLMEGDIYPVFQKPGKRRRKCKPSTEVQKKLNQKNSEKRLLRLVHNNFTENDLILHLSYNQDNLPDGDKEAMRLVGNYLKRLKRKYKKAGTELKYICVTEYGRIKGRVHHHIIINGGLDRDEIEKTWGLGYANTRRLQFDTEDGLKALVHYISKDRHSYKRWNQSRNLEIPVPAERDGAIRMDELGEIAEVIDEKRAYDYFEKLYPEFILVEAKYMRNEINGQIYIHFEMRRRKEYGRLGKSS